MSTNAQAKSTHLLQCYLCVMMSAVLVSLVVCNWGGFGEVYVREGHMVHVICEAVYVGSGLFVVFIVAFVMLVIAFMRS